MEIKLVDGTGNEYALQISEDNRAQVDSITRTVDVDASLDGRAYNLNTGSITLTNASESALMYIKNNEQTDIVISEILVIAGASTGGSGEGVITITKNPTTGTIISSATDVDIVENRNFGSARLLDAHTYKGAQGNTITDGTDFAITSRGSFPTVVAFDAAAIVIPRGSSIGISFQPPTSNTSQSIKIAMTLYVKKS